MPETEIVAATAGPFTKATELLAAQKSSGMAGLAEATQLLRPIAPAARDDRRLVGGAGACRCIIRVVTTKLSASRARLMHEVTIANVCLLLAGVLSGLRAHRANG